MAYERVGTYYYFFPTYQQGKKILWNGMDRQGRRFISHFPKSLVKRVNNQEMLLELDNGSIFQVIGTDNIDSIVGTNPIGCVFSEYSLQNPAAWNFIRPILRENGGWAVFNYTPRGKNHGFELYQMAKSNPDWFCERLTVADTGALSPDDIEAERREGMEEELIQQEYFCSFDAPQQGSYWGKYLVKAEEEGRIKDFPIDPSLGVSTYWDLGVGDSTAIWFVQRVAMEFRVIDYYENSGEGLKHYANLLKEKPYNYKKHIGPHDLMVRELGSGRSRIETALELGIRFDVAPNIPVDDGIDAVRSVLPLCWFHETNTQKGRNCLMSYHKEWDDKNHCYKNKPKHDWSSHGADAFRYFGVSAETPRMSTTKDYGRNRYTEPSWETI